MNAKVEIKQGSAEWFAQRVGNITGSRVGAILGVSPFSKPADVMREMVREFHGAEREFKGNAFTDWGTEHEPENIAMFEVETGQIVNEAGYVASPDFSWLGASPDGYVGENALIECKCPQKIKKLEDVPHYWEQMQLQMHCTGRTLTYFSQWTPEELVIIEVPADPNWLEDRIEQLTAFYAEYQKIIASEELSAPFLEPLEVERKDEAWTTLEKEAMWLDSRIKADTKRLKEVKESLIELADGKKSRGSNALVYYVAGRKSFNKKKLTAEHPELDLSIYETEGKGSWSVKLS